MFKKIIMVAGIIVLCLFALKIVVNKFLNNTEEGFQNDADLMRLEHLVYWTGLIEDYYQKAGYYPFQNQLSSKEEIGLVRIASKQQQQYFNPKSDKYAERLDNNANGFFKEFQIKDFVKELENILDKQIDEKYDIQKAPTQSPIGYNYFISDKGYLLWVTCITCGVTEMSTLLMDGITPTVNIVSDGMKGEVTKALTRKEMISHPVFKKWLNRKFIKEGFAREREKENIRDSKTY